MIFLTRNVYCRQICQEQINLDLFRVAVSLSSPEREMVTAVALYSNNVPRFVSSVRRDMQRNFSVQLPLSSELLRFSTSENSRQKL